MSGSAPEPPGGLTSCETGECWSCEFGYPWCRSCEEHHRPPECPVDQDGFPLAPCGCRWDDEHTCQTYA